MAGFSWRFIGAMYGYCSDVLRCRTQTVVLTVEVSQSREPAVAPTVAVTHLKPHFVATQWRCWPVLPNSTVPVPTGS